MSPEERRFKTKSNSKKINFLKFFSVFFYKKKLKTHLLIAWLITNLFFFAKSISDFNQSDLILRID